MSVGVRELRDSLSAHLARVKQGQTVTVTEHGKVIARIVPVGTPSTLDRLISEGLVTPARKPRRRAPALPKAKGTVSDLVADQRR